MEYVFVLGLMFLLGRVCWAVERRVYFYIKTVWFPFALTFRLVAAVLGGAKWLMAKLRPRRPAYGDARFAKASELNTKGGGFVLGMLTGKTIFTHHEHGCVFFGRAGSGKSSILAASLRRATDEHLIISDPPGALHARFRAELEGKGYKVVRVDLDRPTMAYDVCAMLEKSGPLGFDRDLNALADLLTAELGVGKENAHFTDIARVFVKGILGYLFKHDRQKATPAGVADILLASDEETQKALLNQIMKNGDKAAAMAARAWMSASGPESGSFRSTLTRALEPWIWENVRHLTEWDGDLDNRLVWDDVLLSDEPHAVFLTGGMTEGKDVKGITRTFFGQCAGTLSRIYNASGRIPRGVRLMIDEGASVGRCEPIKEAIVKLRKVGVTVFLCYQSYAQLEEIWGTKGAVTVTDNTDQLVAGGSKDFRHYKAISELAGRKTVSTLQKHESGKSVGEAGGYLITPDEIYGLAPYTYLALVGHRSAVLKGIDGLKQ